MTATEEDEWWSPERVAEAASDRLGRRVSRQSVLKAILSGALPAKTVLGREGGFREVVAYAVRRQDALSWTPRPPGRPWPSRSQEP